MSVDPVKDGVNWYNYCNVNPTTFVDPMGLEVRNAPRGVRYYTYTHRGSLNNFSGAYYHLTEGEKRTLHYEGWLARQDVGPGKRKLVPGSNLHLFDSDKLGKPGEGDYNLYLYTNDKVGQEIVNGNPIESFDLAVGEGVKNGDIAYNAETDSYEQVNSNARFVEVNSRNEFINATRGYYNDVTRAGGEAIDKFSFIGHGWMTQLIMNAEDEHGTEAPWSKVDEALGHKDDGRQGYVDIKTMKSLAQEGIKVKEFFFGACLTAAPMKGEMNIAEATAKAFKTKVIGNTGTAGGGYGKEILGFISQGLLSPTGARYINGKNKGKIMPLYTMSSGNWIPYDYSKQ